MKRKPHSKSVGGALLGLLIWRVGVGSAGAATGDLDPTFAPAVNGAVASAAVDASSGKILIGGSFTSVNGTNRNYLARLNPDGGLDLSFDPGIYPGRPVRHVLLTAGKVLANVGDTVVRLNSNGSQDSGWNEPTVRDFGVIESMALWSTYLYIGGDFTEIWDATSGTWQVRHQVARLTSGGKLDAGFVPAIIVPHQGVDVVLALATQSGGKVLVGGEVHAANGFYGLFRLNHSGTVDTTFAAAYAGIFAPEQIGPQPDGKVLVSGFGGVDYSGQAPLKRLNADGSLDTNFNQTVGPAYTDCGMPPPPILVQANGRILTRFATTALTNCCAACVRHVLRLNPDGSVDLAFQPRLARSNGSPASFRPLAEQSDGKILVAGDFDTVNGLPQPRLARLLGQSDLQFESMERTTNGIRLVMSSEPGQKCALDASADFTHWIRLATNSSLVGRWDFVDSSTTNATQRFYRTVTVP
jgi:uncharacterized delta-60 repeat protein